MQNEIIINADPGETRVAILERSSFTELYIEREGEKGVVGNVVKGRVSRVLPGMQAAFVDIGLEKAGFLYVGDYFSNMGDGDGDGDNGGKRRYGRNRNRTLPKIDSVLREGQEIVVQIAKEPIGSKGARITSNISIPGRHLVLTPGAGRVGVSRRIDSDKERRRLREIVERLRTDDLGFIIRTAGHGVREADLEADVRYLTSVWQDIKSKMNENPAPTVLYSELDLPLKMIRDFANIETKRIAIDSEATYLRLKSFVDRFVADPKPKIERYEGTNPIFDEFSLESQIHDNLERKVWLKSGGHLVIDQSEALTAIDVNTGRFTGKRDLEETIFKTNLEAVREVVYQLRFRNIGGLIIIDLIDMDSADNREKVYRALQEALRADKARTNILKISELGLVEMTRKRTRENLLQTLCEPCSHCEGRGYVLSRKSVAFKVLREIRNDLPRFGGRHIAITVSPLVAEQLLTAGRSALSDLGEELGREIEVRARPGLHQEQYEVMSLDSGPKVTIPLRWLVDPKEKKEAESSGNQSRSRSRGRGGRGRGQGRGRDTATAETETAPAEDLDELDEAMHEAPSLISATASATASNTAEADESASGTDSSSQQSSASAPSTDGRKDGKPSSASSVAPVGPSASSDEPEDSGGGNPEASAAVSQEPLAMDSGKPADEERDEKSAALAKGLRSEPLAVAEVLDEEPESRILPGPQKVEE